MAMAVVPAAEGTFQAADGVDEGETETPSGGGTEGGSGLNEIVTRKPANESESQTCTTRFRISWREMNARWGRVAFCR